MMKRFIISMKGRAATAVSSCEAARMKYAGRGLRDRVSDPMGGGPGPL